MGKFTLPMCFYTDPLWVVILHLNKAFETSYQWALRSPFSHHSYTWGYRLEVLDHAWMTYLYGTCAVDHLLAQWSTSWGERSEFGGGIVTIALDLCFCHVEFSSVLAETATLTLSGFLLDVYYIYMFYWTVLCAALFFIYWLLFVDLHWH